MLVILAIAIKTKKSFKDNDLNYYNEETIKKADEYKNSGEAERYRQQLEEAELKELLNNGYDDEGIDD